MAQRAPPSTRSTQILSLGTTARDCRCARKRHSPGVHELRRDAPEADANPDGDGAHLEGSPACHEDYENLRELVTSRARTVTAPFGARASNVSSGTPVATLGFPGGEFRARRARVGATRTVLYGGSCGPRSVTVFRGTVRRGNSGGPLVNRAGRVAATVFAARVERRSQTGFAVPNDAVREALESTSREAVDTGECAR